MRGRGRGSAPRGFGRGEMMEKLGYQKEDLVLQNKAEPSTFPPLQFLPKPAKRERNDIQAYRLQVKKNFRDCIRNSEYYISLDAKEPEIERYCDQLMPGSKKIESNLYWSHFPAELDLKALPRGKKRKKRAAAKGPNAKRVKKEVDVKVKLEELEKNEDSQDSAEEDEDDPAEVIEDEESDQEMDEDNDYVNAYFDNGDDYLGDDGDGDDDPVYD